MLHRFAIGAPIALAGALLVATPALAGPPWISIEIPANPHNRATRGALLVVHAYHHGTGLQYQVKGTAEGLVGGERVSVPLKITPTGQAGIYAVNRPELDEGRWLLVLRLEDGRAGATALVSLDREGEIVGVQVPSRKSGDGWTIPRAISGAEIDRFLQTGELAVEDGRSGGLPAATAGVAGLFAAVLVPALVRRRRAS